MVALHPFYVTRLTKSVTDDTAAGDKLVESCGDIYTFSDVTHDADDL